MYNKILVPLDGSTFSECSLAHVRAIAKGCQVPEVILMTIVDRIQEFPGMEQGVKEATVKTVQKAAGDYLSKIADELKKEGLNVRIQVLQGPPADKIIDFATAEGVDLVIMSTHGTSGATRWLMGSTADKIVRNVSVPVLAVTPESCRI
jgi:nucleotide-binding universal stress UspA family protein